MQRPVGINFSAKPTAAAPETLAINKPEAQPFTVAALALRHAINNVCGLGRLGCARGYGRVP